MNMYNDIVTHSDIVTWWFSWGAIGAAIIFVLIAIPMIIGKAPLSEIFQVLICMLFFFVIGPIAVITLVWGGLVFLCVFLCGLTK